jgi:trimeric autotransporter adhesin
MKKTTVIVSGIMMVLAMCICYAWADDTDTSLGAGAGTGGTNGFDTYIGAGAGNNGFAGTYNTSVGAGSGYNGGTNNTSLGYFAGIGNSGANNSFLGTFAGYQNEAGNNNIFIGYGAGYSETGSNKLYIDNCPNGPPCSNPFIMGDLSAQTLSLNGQLILLAPSNGFTAGGIQFPDSTTQTTAFTGVSNSTSSVTSLGYYAATVPANIYSTYIGFQAGASDTGGAYNTSVGAEAGYQGGSNNTSLGYYAGAHSGSYNTSIGENAGWYGGNYNTSLGASAGYYGGTENTSLGFYAGYSNTGMGNVFIGYLAGINSGNVSNQLYIDNCYLNSDRQCDTPLIKGDFSTQTLTVNGQVTATNGFVGNGSGLTNVNAVTCTNATTVTNGVYTTGSYANPTWITSLPGSAITGTVPSATIALTATSANTAITCQTAQNATYAGTSLYTNQIGPMTTFSTPTWNGSQFVPGIILQNGSTASVNGTLTVTGLVSLSDERYKRNIRPLQQSLDKVTHLTGVSYEWKTEEYSGKGFKEGRQIGLIAQDVEKVFPELVLTDGKGYKAVAYDKLVSVLIEAVKEQQKTISDNRKVIDEQQNAIRLLAERLAKLDRLEARLNKLESKDMSAQK